MSRFACALAFLITVPGIRSATFAAPSTSTSTTAPVDDDSTNVNWVRDAAIPLKTPEAGNGFDDMARVREIVGPARIVGMGEPTHGTREVFQMKHRMLEFLVTQMGFTAFGIEASMPDCAAFNDYVLNGTGDPERVVPGQGFWTWSTEEVRDMVRWMRAYNADPQHARKIKFYGFDMQYAPSAFYGIRQFLERVDPDAAKSFKPRLHPILAHRVDPEGLPKDEMRGVRDALDELGKQLDGNRDAYVGKSSPDDFAMARRYVVVVQQCIDMNEEQREMYGPVPPHEQMRLGAEAPKKAKELAAFLKEHHPELAERSESLLKPIAEDLDTFSEKFVDKDTTPAARKTWVEQADAIQKALEKSEDQPDHAQWAKAKKASDDVVIVMKMVQHALTRMERKGGYANVRDRSMAENIGWILQNEGPASRIMIWAHNGHIGVADDNEGRGVPSMGTYLRRAWNADYRPIGFVFNQGSFQAAPARPEQRPSLREWSVGPSKEGSVDATFAKAGMPMFILDVRNAPDDPVREWLNTPHPTRIAGAVYDDQAEAQYYAPVALAKAYDAVIFIDRTTRARPLALPPYSSMDPESVAAAGRRRLGVRLKMVDGRTVVDEPLKGSIAESAGVKAGDVLVRVGDHEIKAIAEVVSAVSKLNPGESFTVTVERDGRPVTLAAKVPPAK
jgi:erythromycin esterase-like protein